MCAAICVAPCTPCRAAHLVFLLYLLSLFRTLLFIVPMPMHHLSLFLSDSFLSDSLFIRIEFQHDEEQDGETPQGGAAIANKR